MPEKIEGFAGMFRMPLFFRVPEQLIPSRTDEVQVRLIFPSGEISAVLNRHKDFKPDNIVSFRNKTEQEAVKEVQEAVDLFTLAEELDILSRSYIRQQKKIEDYRAQAKHSRYTARVVQQSYAETAERCYKLEKLLKANGIEVPR